MASDDDELRRKVAERVIKTAAELTRLLAGGQVETPPEDLPLYAALERFGRDRAARAEILAQAIELTAPVLELTAQPVLAQYLPVVWRLEHRCADSAWLEQRGNPISAGLTLHATVEPSRDPFSGEELFLLDDGRLGALQVSLRREGSARLLSIISATLLEPAAALCRWDLAMLLQHLEISIRSAAGTDAEQRRERLRALIVRAGEALLASTESLEAVVKPG